MLPNFVIQACRIDFVYRIYFWFSFNCACASFKHKVMYLYIWSEMEKWGASLFLKLKYVPPLDPANPLYYRRVLSIYTIYVSGKLGQGGGGTIFSKPKKMSGQTPVWKKYTQMAFKMGSRSPNHSQIFASCHLCKLVQDYYKYRNSFNSIRRDNNKTNANSNVDVIACFT